MSENLGNEQTPPVETLTPVEPKMVEQSVYEATKNDMHKYKRMAQEATERQNEYEQKLKDIETNQQKSQGKYKELYEAQSNELNDYKGKYEGVLDSVVGDKKLTAVREFALKHNIRSEALEDLDMVDMSSVVVETTDQGRYNVLGADSFVDRLKSSKPHWFKDATAPNLNNNLGSFDGKDKTYSGSELLSLEKKDPTLYREIMNNKRHLIRR